ncbi:putative transcription regulator Others family [Medicago truncatula]|uniref:Putative transcription regulator Others family n=1 Tax=Medicago truncatula TaxID=3880 RepID=A0A396IJ92_MEDTR|nr:putative transcription regulator Others family [Medicago truncatula]
MKKLSVGDALSLLAAVKRRFGYEKREKYGSFLQIMKDFKAERIDARDVKLRVYELLDGHEDLISKFNIFLPAEYEIKLPLDRDDDHVDQQEGRMLETKDASAFLEKVKDMFDGKNEEKYHEFLEIVKDFKIGRIDISVTAARGNELFQGHTDLILGFNAFLAKKYRITPLVQLDTG